MMDNTDPNNDNKTIELSGEIRSPPHSVFQSQLLGMNLARPRSSRHGKKNADNALRGLPAKSPLPIIITHGNAQAVDVACNTIIILAHANSNLPDNGSGHDKG